MSLRKEMTVAILFGLLLGGGVAAGLRFLPSSSTNTDTTNTSPTTDPEPSAVQLLEKAVELEILLPEQQAFVIVDTVTVSGKTSPSALIALSSPIDERIVIADGDGSFSAELKLAEGANELFVVSQYNGSSVEKVLIINYTSDTIE